MSLLKIQRVALPASQWTALKLTQGGASEVIVIYNPGAVAVLLRSKRRQSGHPCRRAVAASKFNVNISSGSIGNTAFAINAGTALIGTVLPKTACGTTSYDSGPTRAPPATPQRAI